MAALPLAVAEVSPSAAADSIAAEVGPAVAGPLTEAEYGILIGKIQDEPVSPSSYYGGTNTAPTTSGIDDITVDEDADPETISLYDVFDDAEDADSALQYEIVENTNYGVAYGGDLVDGDLELIFGTNVYGTTDLTVRATDTRGAWVETTFTVTVNAVNDAPVISGFACDQQFGDYWVLSGTVTDVDDDVEGMVVDFGGVFSSYGVSATVQSDGTFWLGQQFAGLGSGWASAQTQDDDGASSNVASYFIV